MNWQSKRVWQKSTSLAQDRQQLTCRSSRLQQQHALWVGYMAQLHAHHPEAKGGILIRHQLQRRNAVHLMQCFNHIK